MRSKKILLCALCMMALIGFMVSACGIIEQEDGPPSETHDTAQENVEEPKSLIINSAVSEPEVSTTKGKETEKETEADSIDAMVQKMSLPEKVGQLFIIRPDALDFSLSTVQIDDPNVDGVTGFSEEMSKAMKEYPVGGIIMFGRNLTSPEQITAFNGSLQEDSNIPLFLCIDEEGGSVARLANHPAFDLPKYESAAEVGKNGDAREAKNMGEIIGGYLKTYGFNMDFAPDADVNTNPDNPVIGTRAFSSDAKTAALLAGAMAEGLSSQGIVPVFKHFPGHGDTAEDSHAGIAVTHKMEEELESCEWLPFRQAKDTDCVMVGHIAAPEITGDLTPSTMSGGIISGILKGKLGFKGLVVTDSLSMKAVTDTYTPGEAALAALRAGCDILLMPVDYRQAFDAVAAAVESGEWQEQELDRIVSRILKFKQIHNIL